LVSWGSAAVELGNCRDGERMRPLPASGSGATQPAPLVARTPGSNSFEVVGPTTAARGACRDLQRTCGAVQQIFLGLRLPRRFGGISEYPGGSSPQRWSVLAGNLPESGQPGNGLGSFRCQEETARARMGHRGAVRPGSCRPEHVEELGQLVQARARSSQPPGMMRESRRASLYQGSVRVDQVIAMPLVDLLSHWRPWCGTYSTLKPSVPVPDALLPERKSVRATRS